MLRVFVAGNNNQLLVLTNRERFASYIKLNKQVVGNRRFFFNAATIPWHQIVDVSESHNRVKVKTSETEVRFGFSSASCNEQKIKSLVANHKKG
jgi:hypothetical protein